MKRISSLCASLLIALGTMYAPIPQAAEDAAAAKSGETVCAVVNGKDITEQQVLSEMDKIIQGSGRQIPPQLQQQAKVQMYTGIVDKIVTYNLLQDIAKEKQITVDDQDLEKEIQRVKAELPSEEDFKKALEQRGMTEESFKQLVRENLLPRKVVDTQMKPVNEADIAKFYEENKAEMKQEETVHASHILISVPQTATAEQKAQAKQKIETIRKDIVDNKIAFADAAKANSDCPSKSKGGDLGEFKKGDMVPPFEQAAFTLDPGKVSDVVETQFGYHIIQVQEHNQPKELTLEESKDTIKSQLEDKSRMDYLEQIKKDAKIEMKVTQEDWAKKYAPAQPKQNNTIQIDPNQLPK